MSVPGGKADEISGKAHIRFWMSSFGGRADVACQDLSGPFLAKTRHSLEGGLKAIDINGIGPIRVASLIEAGLTQDLAVQASKVCYFQEPISAASEREPASADFGPTAVHASSCT